MTKNRSLRTSGLLSRTMILLSAAGAAAAGVGCSPPEEAGPDDIQSVSSPITNGYTAAGNSYAAAVYRWLDDTGTWSAPCSGVVLKRVPGRSIVLTARSCVTSNGTVTGPLRVPSKLRVSTALSPGVTPPSTAVAPSSVSSKSNPTLSAADNFAVVVTSVELPTPGTGAARLAIHRGTRASIDEQDFYTSGYGTGGPAGGAGILRNGFDFHITSATTSPPLTTSAYTFTNSGTGNGGAAVLQAGDIGSPHLYNYQTGATTVSVLLGITVNAATPSANGSSASGMSEWLQNSWGMYLSPFASATYNAGANGGGPADGGWLYGRFVGDSVNTRTIQYIASSKQLRFAGSTGYICLQPESGYVRLRTCTNATNQEWTVTDDFELKHLSTGQCIRDAGEWPAMGACDGSTATKWFWHMQP